MARSLMNDTLHRPGRHTSPNAISPVMTQCCKTLMAPRGMVTAPHHLAAETMLSVLREDGNAIEAMVAAAATIAVVDADGRLAGSEVSQKPSPAMLFMGG
jgi:hypothetical protein